MNSFLCSSISYDKIKYLHNILKNNFKKYNQYENYRDFNFYDNKPKADCLGIFTLYLSICFTIIPF